MTNTLEQFKKDLENFDWFYEYQDSFHPISYRKSEIEFSRLEKIANSNEEYKLIFNTISPIRKIK